VCEPGGSAAGRHPNAHAWGHDRLKPHADNDPSGRYAAGRRIEVLFGSFKRPF